MADLSTAVSPEAGKERQPDLYRGPNELSICK